MVCAKPGRGCACQARLVVRGFVERKTLLACILATGAIFIDISVVNVVLPDVRNDLHTSLAQEQWIVNAYLITMTAFVLPSGVMGDVWGHRRMLMIGCAAFAVATILVGLAPPPSKHRPEVSEELDELEPGPSDVNGG